ncbi:unnamed protein product [Diabrotica balteata]|uniref:Ig-like domain-containing protein n=1 Tax=Diabrotica balteata TaxID=107213 RepID=A0A9N9T654_DIABA|nr:unnamed protein product [Diabrotica balteata]
MNEHVVPVTELCFDGNMADNWSFFEQKFKIFLEASKLNEENDSLQGSVLLNRIGDRALRIYNNFEWSSDESKTSCKVILTKFKEYFTPSKNVTYERYLFFTQDKIGLQTYDLYVTELRQLASTCEFDTLTDSLIRDRLILGISDVSLKDRLLREQGLTLSRGLEICRAAEVAARQLSVISGANSSQSLKVLEIQKQKKHQSNRSQQLKPVPQCTSDCGQYFRNHPQMSGNQKIKTHISSDSDITLNPVGGNESICNLQDIPVITEENLLSDFRIQLPENVDITNKIKEVTEDTMTEDIQSTSNNLPLNQWSEGLSSKLHISNAHISDSGNYSCVPTIAGSTSVNVHVINGEHPAAMQHGNKNTASLSLSIQGTIVYSIFVIVMKQVR